MAVTLEEIEWLEENFVHLHSRLRVGFNFEYSDFFIEASKHINDLSMGEPISALFQISHGLATKKEFQHNWRAQDNDPFSQLVCNLAIHYIYASQRLFGTIQSSSLVNSNFFRQRIQILAPYCFIIVMVLAAIYSVHMLLFI